MMIDVEVTPESAEVLAAIYMAEADIDDIKKVISEYQGSGYLEEIYKNATGVLLEDLVHLTTVEYANNARASLAEIAYALKIVEENIFTEPGSLYDHRRMNAKHYMKQVF